MNASISALYIYPVKSLAGISLSQVNVLPTGLEGDRQWMIADNSGKFVTQRQIPAMATIKTHFVHGQLSLSHEYHGTIEVTQDPKTPTALWQIWKDTVEGIEESQAVSDWLTQVLGEFRGGKLRLVRFNNNAERLVATRYLENQESTLKLADACPFLITCEASLSDLNQHLPQPMPMDRFRANIILADTQPWQEYQWQNLRADSLDFAMIGPCQRCPMTSVDQQRGVVATPGQPLQTLMERFKVGDKKLPYFGQHAHLPNKDTGTLVVGQSLQILTGN